MVIQPWKFRFVFIYTVLFVISIVVFLNEVGLLRSMTKECLLIGSIILCFAGGLR